MMPCTADRKLFATCRALALALERLLPLYRGRCVSALARALADEDRKAIGVALKLLRPSDIARAHQKASKLQRRRDAASIERALAGWLAALGSVFRMLAKLRRTSK